MSEHLKVVCLCPTYGRSPALLNNTLACFDAQTHKNRVLMLYDDLGTLHSVQIDSPSRVVSVSRARRSSSVGAKYNEMIDIIQTHYLADIYVVWDDDDVYLPDHITSHVRTIAAGHKWSKPSRIISAYHSPPAVEDASGRFHGSIAVRADVVKEVPWIDTVRATFDQEYIAALTEVEPPGDPCAIMPPQYVYRWQTSGAGHCSGLMGSPTWYADYRPDYVEHIDWIEPKFDADTERLMALPPM